MTAEKKKSRWRIWTMRIGLSLVALSLLAFAFQRRLLYNNWAPTLGFPPHRDVEVEDVWFNGAAGRIHGWFAACPTSIPSAVPGDRPVILFCHGTGGTLPRWRWVAARWQDALGADVLLFDYCGYGKSEGRPYEAGLYDSAHEAYKWLTETKRVDPRRIIFVGQSLGGGVATELAVTVDHRMLILESTFTSIPDLVNDLCFGLPVGRVVWDKFPNERRLEGYRRPLFLSHGTGDLLISPSHSKRLQAQATGPTELLLIPGMRHHDERPASYGPAVRRFVQANW
jgi:fermentation-respiration switch protein FrsA (DUF1100 family)